MNHLLTLEEAQARLLSLAPPLETEHVGIADALGRYLSEPLHARRTQPAADLSAMDGYAVHGADLSGPWRVIGESAAGHPFAGEVVPGHAVRVATGALLPEGAQSVILQEDCRRSEQHLELTGTPPSPPDRHIRRRGMDFTEGTQLLAAGTRIGPAHIALALSAGHTHLPVCRLPRLAIIDSGDELAPHGEPCPPHRLPASNGMMLGALASRIPCLRSQTGPVPDDLAQLVAALDKAAEADVIVTSGGASVGDRDLIRPALDVWGAELDFWKVAIKPGKPLMVAKKGSQLVIGLPGNPVSSFVTACLFLLPLLRRLSGATECLPHAVHVPLSRALPPTGGRREFLRAVWDGESVAPGSGRDSSALASLAACNGFIDRPADAPALEAGAMVPFYLFETAGFA